MNNGIHRISNKIYHSSHALSSTGLKQLVDSKTPAHFKQYLVEEKKTSAEMLLGTLIHSLLLEPEVFPTEFVVGDFARRAGKVYEQFVVDNKDKTIITKEEFETASKAVASIHEHAKDNETLFEMLKGHKEISFFWTHPVHGFQCRVRTDILNNAIVDLKTTKDASQEGFGKSIANFKYHVSAAYYLNGVQETLQAFPTEGFVIPKEFKIIAVETSEPFLVSLHKIPDRAIELGWRLMEEGLDTLAECLATDSWPGYSKEIVETDLPAWEYTRFQRRGRK